jgi:23S rRNA pseudouridine2605 synthase
MSEGRSERLQKILARAGVASRRKAEELIREGRVTVNGQVAAIGDKADPERDSVKLDQRRIQLPASHRYLLLNKPRGVMSTVSDPGGRQTVIDLVPPALRRALVPVGRLDFLTEGLLLLTDDGELAQRVAHPSFGCWKTYEVKVRGRPAAEELERLRAGIVLEGRRTAPCRIAALRRQGRTAPGPAGRRSRGAGTATGRQRGAGTGGPRGADDAGAAGRRRPRRAAEAEADSSSWWSVELGEGRTRQIREMFQRIGHPVQKLRRVAIGPVSDPDLPLGALRELSEREVAALRRVGPPGSSAARGERGAGPRQAAAAREAGREAGRKAGRETASTSRPKLGSKAPQRGGPAAGRRGGPGARKRSDLAAGKRGAPGRGGASRPAGRRGRPGEPKGAAPRRGR